MKRVEMTLSVQITRCEGCDDLALPAYATPGSAGMDLFAAVCDPLVLEPGQRALVPSGIRIALPEGYEAQVRPRSGLAVRHGIGMVNAPGTIDSDYRGEIAVPLINLGQTPVTIHRGDRIAQMVVAPVTRVVWQESADLEDTDRGSGGFGSTGGLSSGH